MLHCQTELKLQAGRATSSAPATVLVSTVRPDRNVVALVTKTGDVPVVASNGFCLLRADGVPPELVFAFCKTDAFPKAACQESHRLSVSGGDSSGAFRVGPLCRW